MCHPDRVTGPAGSVVAAPEPLSGPARSGGLPARAIVLVVLGCGVLAKAADASPHPSFGYVPFVLGVYALPCWYASGRRREPWNRHPGPLLALQAVATVVPFVIFGAQWVGGASGPLAGLVLLVLPGRRGWLLFAGLAAGELAGRLLVGLPYTPHVNALGWLLVGFVYHALTLYGLTRLAELVDRLDATRAALAEATVTRLRLAATARVDAEIVQRLEELTRLAVRAAQATTAVDARRQLAAAGRLARQTGAAARRLVVALPGPRREPASPPETADTVTPRLARGITAVVLAVFSSTYLLNIAVPVAVPRHSVAVVILAFGVAGAVTALQWRHVSYDAVTERPAGWPWTLAAQAALCFVLFPAAGVASVGLLVFPGSSGLLLIRHWTRWLCFAAVVLGMPALAFAGPADLSTLRDIVTWSIYASATEASACLVIYGLVHLTRASSLLHELRRNLADGVAATESLRLTRDAHDTLGLGLSTVALKTDLAAALLDRDRDRARHEIAQLLHVAVGVASDATAVTTGRVDLDLDRELDSARQTLRAAAITTTMERARVPLPAPIGSAFAMVTREAVTNVLRHSAATVCVITVAADDDRHALSISNDGGGRSFTRGNGLRNMRRRIDELGGTVETSLHDGRFALTVTVPLPVAPDSRLVHR